MEIKRSYLMLGAGGVIFVLAAVAGLWERASGTGTLHVVGPRTGAVTIFVDGEQRNALAAREHHRLELPQGAHEIRLVPVSGQERTHQIVIENGGYAQLVPCTDQCFVDLDVTDVHYTRAQQHAISVVGRHFDGRPFDVSRDRYYSEGALPNQISRGARAHLVLEVPCNMASASDAALAQAAGYGAPAPGFPRRR